MIFQIPKRNCLDIWSWFEISDFIAIPWCLCNNQNNGRIERVLFNEDQRILIKPDELQVVENHCDASIQMKNKSKW